MTFLHVSDLHIGKKLCGRSLIDDQRHMLEQLIEIAASARVDAVLIAGDIYDRPQPGSEAIALVGTFFAALAKLKKPVFAISGNHDSGEQIAYCGEILSSAQLYLSPVFRAAPERHVLRDDLGEIHIYMLPFLRPMQLRRAFPERAAEIAGYADALRVAVESIALDDGARNVLLAHQFVVGGDMTLTDSEEHMVGGVDAIPAALFGAFDYVALGHLHAPQRAGGARLRYAGSPMKYSLSEEHQRKVALLVTLGEKGGEPVVEELPLRPLHELKSIRGELQALLREDAPDMDYAFITLTDELPPIDPVGALLQSYPNYMQLRIENSRTSGTEQQVFSGPMEHLTPLEHFERFYAAQNNAAQLSSVQQRILHQVISEAEEENAHETD